MLKEGEKFAKNLINIDNDIYIFHNIRSRIYRYGRR